MNLLKSLFWNSAEKRLRAGYRILITLVIFRISWMSLGFLFNRIPGFPTDISADVSFWYFLVPAFIRLLRVLISLWLAGIFLDHRPFSDFGLRIDKKWWTDLGFGMFVGILLMGGIFLTELSAGWLSIRDTFHTAQVDQSFAFSIIVMIILFICVGFSEELFYRGYHLTNLAEGFNIKLLGPQKAVFLAVFLSSVLFGVFHMGSPNASAVSTINIILWGALFSMPYIFTGSLAIPVGLHISWNFFQGNVFGFPVSGVTMLSEVVSFFSVEQSGPELWTGGAFGPEAGLLTLFALIIGLALITAWIKIQHGKLQIYQALAETPK